MGMLLSSIRISISLPSFVSPTFPPSISSLGKMVDAFIEIAIEKLVGLGEDELKLLRGTREEVEKLLDILKTIRPYLLDAEVKQFNDTEVGVWLKKLKVVAYEADDVLDEWQTKSQQQSTGANLVWNFFAQCTCFRQLALRHTVGKKIQKINGKLDDIHTLSEKFKFLKSTNVTNVMGEGTNFLSVIRKNRQTDSSVENMFGRNDEIKRIKDKLMNSSETSKHAVVSIVGSAGFGKTTLAKSVFNDGEIVKHYEERIWVCVSDEFDVTYIMKKMIEAAKGDSSSVSENQEALRKKIADEVLKGKLFLLVLDDVWNEDHEKWDKLFNVIKNCGLRGSRILVTTRSENVCKVIGAHKSPLSNISSFKDCWSIFESVAFENIGETESERQNFRTVGEAIVKKCKGVPLAIKTVAGVLRTKSTTKDWEYVLESNMWNWKPESMMGILPALFLSYYHLSPQLKQCFRYCAIYPKDKRISKDKIVQRWIAHGYISEKENMELEDEGENYFDEFLARSLFQEPELDEYNNITHCKMHDLIHDLAQFVTKGEFLHVSKEKIIEPDDQYPPLHCTMSNMESLNIKINDVEKLRTFIYTPCNERELGIRGIQIEKMRRLRELSYRSLEELPDVVGNYVHLRYLKLRKGKFKAMPSSIGELQNLLYLDLSKNENLKALPSTIGRLTNLRKLKLKSAGLDEIPDCIGKLASLQVLDIYYCEKLEKLPDSIKDLSRLQVLNVSLCTKLGQLPAGIFDKMTGLKELRVVGCRLQGLPAGIGKLTQLQRLNHFWVLGSHEDEKEGSSSSTSVSSSNICELRDLNHLHGHLTIHNLDTVASWEEAASAQLHNKTSLSSLILEWNTDGRGGAKEETTSEDVLQALRPCPTLPQLSIGGYPGRTVPSWLGESTNLSGLQNLHLHRWDGCTNLPALGNLPELRGLQIDGMPKVRRVGAEWFGSNHAFPKLEYLGFEDMGEWEEWDNSLVEELFFTFPSLIELEISDCPKLRSLPPIFSPSSLQKIKVHRCSSLTNWLGILPASIVTLGSLSAEWVNGLPSLPNLEHLTISGGEGVSKLSNNLVKLGALKRLKIEDCPNLESLPQEMASLKQLQTLKISNCGKLRSLPSLPNLEELTISGDDGVSELSNDLVNKLGALKRLEIEDCPNLKSLPREMASLKQLQELTIWRCPKLNKSCNKDGAQWYKIQHIPSIWIHGEHVRRNA